MDTAKFMNGSHLVLNKETSLRSQISQKKKKKSESELGSDSDFLCLIFFFLVESLFVSN